MTATPENASAPTAVSEGTINSQEVGMMFVHEYYTIVHREPSRLHCFYNKSSTMNHGIEGEDPAICHGQQEIHSKILDLDFEDCRVLVRSVDSQKSLNGGIMVQVLGEMSNRGGPSQRFVQTFFLAEQPQGYYVLNDIFRYLKEPNELEPDAEEVSDDITDETDIPVAAPEAVVDEAVPIVANVEADTEAEADTATVIPAIITPPVEVTEPAQPAKEEAPVVEEKAAVEDVAKVVEEKKPPTEEKKPVEKKSEHKKHDRKSDKKESKKESKKDDNKEVKKDDNKEFKKDDNKELKKDAKKDGNKEAKKDNRKETEPANEPKVPEPSTNLNGTATPTPSSETAQADDSVSAAASTTPAAAPAAPVTAPAEPPSKPSSWAGLFTNNSSQSAASQTASKTTPVVVPQQAPKPQAPQTNAPLGRSRPQGGQRPNGRDDVHGVYVRNVTDKMSVDQLREAFSAFGPVKHVELTGLKRTCAFVDFETVEAVQAALSQNKVSVGSEFVLAEERYRPSAQNGGSRSFSYQNGNGPNNHQGSHGGHRGGRASRGGGGYDRKPMQKPEKAAPTVTVN